MSDVEPQSASPGGIRVRLGAWVNRAEALLFTALLTILIALGLAPIASRFFGTSAVVWGDEVSKQLVLWIALFGAIAASGDRKHISVDVLGQLLPSRWRIRVRGITYLAAGGICGYLTPIAIEYVRAEFESRTGQREAFLGIPEAWLPVVIPVGLGLLTLRLLLAGGADLFLGELPGSDEPDAREGITREEAAS